MGGRQHQLIARLVAEEIGIDDPTVLALASAYPDARNDPKFAQVASSADKLRSPHHSRKRAQDVYGWLWAARRDHLKGNERSRDRALGIALHYIADAYSPFGGGAAKHNEFEARCGRYADRALFQGVDQRPNMVPHHTAKHIFTNLRDGPARHSTEKRFVREWLQKVYFLSLLATRGVAAPRYSQASEELANQAYESTAARLEELTEKRRRKVRFTLDKMLPLLSQETVWRVAKVAFRVILCAAVALPIWCLYLFIHLFTRLDILSVNFGQILWLIIGFTGPLLFAVMYGDYGLDWNLQALDFVANLKRHWRAWAIAREYAGYEKKAKRDYRQQVWRIGDDTDDWYLKPSHRL